MTSIITVFSSSTTRLAAVVHYLEKQYGWLIDREAYSVGTNDGRVASVSEYFIRPEAIAIAMLGEANRFCSDVVTARYQQRLKAEEKREEADRNNAARLKHGMGVGAH